MRCGLVVDEPLIVPRSTQSRQGTWMLQSDTACRRLHVPRGVRYPWSLRWGATVTLVGGSQ
jgi:hypothetical protein